MQMNTVEVKMFAKPNDIPNIFLNLRNKIVLEQDIRETIRQTCEEIRSFIRDVSVALNEIHHINETTVACTKAREGLQKIKVGYAKLSGVVPEGCYYKFYDHWRSITQQSCCLITFTVWLENGSLATYDMVADELGISTTKQNNGFPLYVEDYLIGVFNVTSELVRLAINSVARGDYTRPLKISMFVTEINEGFEMMNMTNELLLERFEVFEDDVQKIEEVVSDLSVRGLLPIGEN